MNDIPGGDRPATLQAVQDWQRRAGRLRRVHLRLSPRLRSVAVVWAAQRPVMLAGGVTIVKLTHVSHSADRCSATWSRRGC
jgi:hypothetical protein